MVIYEWKDVKYLGKVTSYIDDYFPVSFFSLQLCYSDNLRPHSRRHMFAPPMLSGVGSATDPSWEGSSSIYRPICP